MSHKYKLTYFNFHGRAEAARMLFALAGVEYEDHRIEWTSDEWKELKPKTPFGGLPLLEVDGRVFSQSVAIARYLANQFGLAGKTELDKLQVDMIADCIVDLATPFAALFQASDEAKRMELWKEYEPKLDKHLENLQKLLEANNGGNGFFVGDSITWVDCYWSALLYWINHMKYGPTIDKHPKLKAVQERVEAEPRIAEWIKKRPKADF